MLVRETLDETRTERGNRRTHTLSGKWEREREERETERKPIPHQHLPDARLKTKKWCSFYSIRKLKSNGYFCYQSTESDTYKRTKTFVFDVRNHRCQQTKPTHFKPSVTQNYAETEFNIIHWKNNAWHFHSCKLLHIFYNLRTFYLLRNQWGSYQHLKYQCQSGWQWKVEA